MAEILEEMQERALPEYENMLRFGICTEENLKACIAKRRNFQSKITQSQKDLRSYVDYIAYEKTIHKWVLAKEDDFGKALIPLKASIMKRIMNLFRQALSQFPHDVRLWGVFIAFCKKNAKHEVMGVYEKMLSYHADEPSVWCDAALWAYEYSGNMAKVKELFVRALHRHPASETVNTTFFQILLSQAVQMSNEKNLADGTMSEQDLGLQQVEVVYRNSRREIKNLGYYLGLLERCESKEFNIVSARIQKKILDDVMDEFASNEELWHALAQRELRGYHMSDLIHFFGEDKNAEEETALKAKKPRLDSSRGEDEEEDKKPVTSVKKFEWQNRSLSRRIEMCCTTYKKAVETLRTEKMWDLYINAMLSLNEDVESHGDLKRKSLSAAFKAGHAAKLLSIEHYGALMKMMLFQPNGWERAAHILIEALDFKSSPKLYLYTLQALMHDKEGSKFEEIFRRGVKELPVTEAYELYELYHKKCLLEDKNLDAFYKEVSHIRDRKYSQMRVDYLDYVLMKDGIVKARKVYEQLSQLPPPEMELNNRMAHAEVTFSRDMDGNYSAEGRKRWRFCLERNLMHFGKDDTEVWLHYMNYEKQYGDPKNVSLLYDRAKAALHDDLVDKFISEYMLQREKQTCMTCVK